MKKYLFTAALAVAVSGAFVSCHEDEISGSLIEQKAKAFEETFIEAFGQPAPNHNWGFKTINITKSNSDVITRGDSKGEVIKPDMTNFPGYSTERCNSSNYRSPEGYADIVEPITAKEAAWVQAWFDDPENTGLSEEGEDFDNFFVQQVAHRCYNTDKPGYFWEMKDGVEEKTEKTYNVKMDQLRIGPTRDASEDATLHINDFNAVDNGENAWNLIYVQGGSSKQFGYYASYDSQWQWLFRCVQLTVPGNCFEDGVARTGWYVGLSYWTDKEEVAGQKGERIGENDVNQGNDWILKIVPGETTPTPPTPPSESDQWKIVEGEEVMQAGRVFCEDLGASSLNDVDYNDVVFDAIIVNHYIKLVTTKVVDGVETTTETTNFTLNGITGLNETYAKVCLLAAGGTIPANVCGHEIHNELSNGNLSTVVMINTTTDRESVNGAQIDYSCSPVIIQESVSGQEGVTQDKKFYVNSQGNPITCINDIDIVVLYGNAVTTITAPTGAVPYKICVPIGTPWAKERVNIGIAFTSFAEYCGINPDKQFWNDIGKDGPVWENCGSLFTIQDNGVTRFLDEGDLLGDGETILAQSTGSSGGGSGAKPGQFWPSNNTSGNATQYFEIGSGTTNTVFSSATASQKLCIYCTIGNSSWLKINRAGWSKWTLTDLNSSWRIVGDNKELEPVNGLSSVYNQTKGCIEVQLSAGLINEIKASGIGLNFGNDNMTITNITIE